MDNEIAFEQQGLKKSGLLNKVLGTKPIENLKIEINNLLANKSIQIITPEELHDLAASYKTKLSKHSEMLGNLYQQYLAGAVKDGQLTDKEIADMKRLKELLLISDQTVAKVHKEVYALVTKQVVQDSQVDDQEKAFLDTLVKELQLPEKLAADIYRQNASVLVQGLISGITSDQMISPEEEAQLQALGKSLRLDLQIDEKSKEVLDKYKLIWRITNGEMPTIEPTIKLQKDEVCYFNTPSKYFENRTVTKSINYSGPSISLKIAKGVYWRTGSMKSQRITQEVFTHLDSGTLFVTNKRLIFMGSKGSKSTPFNKILDFEGYKNGFEIYKDSGKPMFFEVSQHTDIALLIFGRALEEA